MSGLSRREAFVGALAIAAAPALPRVVCEAVAAQSYVVYTPAKELLPAWIVGDFENEDGGLDVVRALTPEGAIATYLGGDGDCTWAEDGEGDPQPTPCECYGCWTRSRTEIQRAEAWDQLEKVTPADWIRQGLGHTCSRCHDTMACAGMDGHAVGNEAVCEECMTLADWDIVDPRHAAELRADLEDDEPSRPLRSGS